MIISKKYALKLVKLKKAEVVGVITQDGKKYVAINRFDKQRTDHFIEKED